MNTFVGLTFDISPTVVNRKQHDRNKGSPPVSFRFTHALRDLFLRVGLLLTFESDTKLKNWIGRCQLKKVTYGPFVLHVGFLNINGFMFFFLPLL